MTENELKSELKYCVVKNDKEKLKQILRDTVSLRQQILKKHDDGLKELWTFYLVDTELVLINFSIMHISLVESK